MDLKIAAVVFLKMNKLHFGRKILPTLFIRLRLNTLLLAAGMKGKVNRAEAQ
jgi:hypothetical protein